MEIPSGITVSVTDRHLVVEGGKGIRLKRPIPRHVQVAMDGHKVEFKVANAKKLTRPVKAELGAMEAHLRNMVAGVQKPFEKNLQLVYSHFPVTVEVKGSEVFIKNFLGEKTPRKAKIHGKASVAVKGQDIVVTGADCEDVGQTASNLVRATKILRRDIRVFQDGIYYAL